MCETRIDFPEFEESDNELDFSSDSGTNIFFNYYYVDLIAIN
jgi:hypothetical protein